MTTKRNNILGKSIGTLALIVFVMLLISGKSQDTKDNERVPDTIVKIIHDTTFVHDTVIKTVVSYMDTTPIVIQKKKSFLYIKDTFNIEDRTYYITEKNDTVKVFYFDYTYYIFKYHLKDTLVAVDSVLGCDLYTHCICDDRERVVIFHTCEGESRTIVNMLNKQGR